MPDRDEQPVKRYELNTVELKLNTRIDRVEDGLKTVEDAVDSSQKDRRNLQRQIWFTLLAAVAGAVIPLLIGWLAGQHGVVTQ